MYCRSRPQYRSDLGWILGVAFLGTLTRSARPVRGFTFVRCCSTPSGFFPTRPRGAKPDCLATLPPACSCLRLAVATNSLRRGLAPPIQGPCLAHQGLAFGDPLARATALDPAAAAKQKQKPPGARRAPARRTDGGGAEGGPARLAFPKAGDE